MTSQAVRARPGRGSVPAAPSLAARLGWVALGGVWLFLVVALGSFDAADAPSYFVAIHNQPPANLCGEAGAMAAYFAYYVLGGGAWAILAGAALFLAVTVRGIRVSHPLVRLIGLLVLAGGVSGMQRLLLPGQGALVGAPAGLAAEYLVGELTLRFSTVGTGLILLAMLAIGALVSIDEALLAVPRGALAGARLAGRLRRPLRALRVSPGLATAGAARRRRRRRGESGRPIDPDAGGVGATEAFDPEAYEYDEEGEEGAEESDEAVDEEELDGEEEDAADEDEDEDEEATSSRPTLTEEELRRKIARLPLRMSSSSPRIARDEDIPREESFERYTFPALDLLENPETNYTETLEKFVREQARQLEQALNTYGIAGEVVGIESGPVVTLYSVQLGPGTKVAKLAAISSDLARALSAQNVRLVPNTPGKTTVGIEVPNLHKEKVRLKELMSGGHSEGMKLPMFLGKDAAGEPLVADLTRMPHMLIAGTTGSGKSVCMNTIIMSWLYTKRPDELKLVLVDPKMVELNQFADIPHLMCPVVTEMARAAAILEWAVSKMEERYELLNEASVRDVQGYNALTREELLERFEPQNEEEEARIPKRLPYMVFVIDELADLILTHKEVEQFIVRIAQKARAVGIHLIVATQRPQANVVTGLIKSNMPCRVSFKVASGVDSRIVLDHKGAELLLGQGDMMFLSPHSSELRRAQGTLVDDREIRRVVRFVGEVAGPTFERSLLAIRPAGAEDDAESPGERDPLFDKAVEIMIETGRGSVSLLQRRLAIGYSRSSRLVDQMGRAGILGEHRGSVARDVLITLEEWTRMKELEEAAETEGGGAVDVAPDEGLEDDGDVDIEVTRTKETPAA